jgi:hypothetical protein
MVDGVTTPNVKNRTLTLLSRCTQIPEIRLFVFNPFPGFDCIVTALKSRIVAHKTRTNFLLKFVRDISTEMTLTFLRASVSVRDLSTNISTSSGIWMPQNTLTEHIPGFECSVTATSAKQIDSSG